MWKRILGTLKIREISSLRINPSSFVLCIRCAEWHKVHIYQCTCCYTTNSSTKNEKYYMDLHTFHAQWVTVPLTQIINSTTSGQENTVTDITSWTHRSAKRHAHTPSMCMAQNNVNYRQQCLICQHTSYFLFVRITANDHSADSKEHKKVMWYTSFCAMLYRRPLSSHMSRQSPVHIHTRSKTATLSIQHATIRVQWTVSSTKTHAFDAHANITGHIHRILTGVH
jgi:hypothetical protein